MPVWTGCLNTAEGTMSRGNKDHFFAEKMHHSRNSINAGVGPTPVHILLATY